MNKNKRNRILNAVLYVLITLFIFIVAMLLSWQITCIVIIILSAAILLGIASGKFFDLLGETDFY